MTVINLWLATVILQYHSLIVQSKASLGSSREVEHGCGISFVNYLYLVPLIIGQSFCATCARANQIGPWPQLLLESPGPPWPRSCRAHLAPVPSCSGRSFGLVLWLPFFWGVLSKILWSSWMLNGDFYRSLPFTWSYIYQIQTPSRGRKASSPFFQLNACCTAVQVFTLLMVWVEMDLMDCIFVFGWIQMCYII